MGRHPLAFYIYCDNAPLNYTFWVSCNVGLWAVCHVSGRALTNLLKLHSESTAHIAYQQHCNRLTFRWTQSTAALTSWWMLLYVKSNSSELITPLLVLWTRTQWHLAFQWYNELSHPNFLTQPYYHEVINLNLRNIMNCTYRLKSRLWSK